MTAVHPKNRTVKEPDHQQPIKGTPQGTEKTGTVVSQEFDRSFSSNFSPLLNSMRVGGQYFKWPFGSSSKVVGIGTSATLSTSGTASLTDKLAAIYAVVVMTLMWINSFRLILIFVSYRAVMLYDILYKVIFVVWHFQSTIQQTAYFFACRSGRLDKVLSDLSSLESAVPGTRFRGLALMLTITAWMFVTVTMASFVYVNCFTGGLLDNLLAPLGPFISVSDKQSNEIAYVFCYPLIIASWYFPMTMSLMISIVLGLQFRNLSTRMRRMIQGDEVNSIDGVELESVRKQHHKLCHLVRQTDQFMMIYNVGAFIGPLFQIVVGLYILVEGRSLIRDFDGAIYLISFVTSISFLQLFLTAASGLLVNHYAHKINARIHSINLTAVDLRTLAKVNVFLSRTSGEPIGFSVISLMVIDRNSVTSVLGLIVTYFMLILELPIPLYIGSEASSNSNATAASN